MTFERVTAVIPVHDGERYLAETLESVFGQTVPPAEVIVVDDASTDNSAAIAASFGARVVAVECNQPDTARTAGADVAENDLIAFCDADDLWLPHKLERQLEVVATLPTPAGPFLVWTGVDEFVSTDIDNAAYTGREPVSNNPGRLVSSLLTDRSTLTLGESGLAACESWVAWVAGLPRSVVERRVDEALIRRRLHLTNFSARTNSVPQSQAWLTAARRRAERHRSGEL